MRARVGSSGRAGRVARHGMRSTLLACAAHLLRQRRWLVVIALACVAGTVAAVGMAAPVLSQTNTTAYVPAVLNRGTFPTVAPGSATAQPETTPTATATATPDTQLRRQSQSGGDGLSVAATDRFVYVGQGPRVLVYERFKSTALELVGETSALAGVVSGLAVADGLVYAAATSDGVWAIDVSDPLSPRLVANVPARDGSQKIVLQGDHAFVAEGDTGIRVLNLSDPRQPVEAAVKDTGGAVKDVQASADGELLYVMGDDGRARRCCPNMGHLWIFDISDPTAPVELGHLPTLQAYGMAVAGDTVYMNGGFEFLIIDVSDPTLPQVTAALRNVDAVPFAVDGDLLYTQNWDGDHDGLVLVDIRQRDSPVPIADVPEAWGEAGSVDSSVAFVTGYKAVYVVDASIPTEPSLTDTARLLYAGWAIHDLGDGLAYVGLSPPVVADISDAAQPSFSPLDESAWPWDDIMDSSDRTVVARSREVHSDVALLDASDPLSPVQLALIEVPYRPQMARMHGDRLYVNYAGGLGASMLHVYDVTDPTEPILLGERSIGWIASELEFLGTYAYLTLTPYTGDTADDSPGRLQVLDVTDPSDLRVLGEVQFAHSAVGLEVSSSRGGSSVTAYAVTMDWTWVGGCGLYVVDVSDPEAPAIQSFVPTAGPATGAVLHGDDVIVSVHDVGSRHTWPQYAHKLSGRGLVFDRLSRYNPELRQTLLWGSWTIWPGAMASIDGVLWVAAVGGGLSAWQ